ncbi:MAG: heavy metal translocating P-type ATPase [Candidatus Adiutrix sp.]|jgi:Cu2+-exporting ATPase/Cu+-exporting ATPase|nr:heavy metal translocating P-type ATPase [Candidatus Adiutrix sp.]
MAVRQEHFDISGMTCSACSRRVHQAAAALDGVREANVNLLKNRLTVSFDERAVSANDVAAAVEKAGYGAALRNGQARAIAAPTEDPAIAELRAMKVRLGLSFLFTVPLFYLAMGHMAGLPLPGFFLGAQNAAAFAFTQLLLTVPVVAVNFKYYRVGFKTLFAGAPNMDSLIALGSGAAVVFSVYTVYKMLFALGAPAGGDHLAIAYHYAESLYFESAAMILTLITLGKFFEARAKGKTSEALTKLMNLAPKTATVRRAGREEEIPLEEVRVGDALVVKAGAGAPVDGVIIEGAGFLDESALTGESLPVEKKAGDAVTGATINTAGHFVMRAERVGDDTTLAQIIKLVDEATSSQAPIARLADRISGVFVPVVIAVALGAAAAWLALGHDLEFALTIGISVLVISCPCALGLATPTAIMVGTGRGAVFGILLKSAQAIETAQSVDTVVLDKTGTVTEGRPAVTEIVPAEGLSEAELLAAAYSLEKLSEHPLGKAIVAEAEKRGLAARPVEDFAQIPGQGLAGSLDGRRILAGNARIFSEAAAGQAWLEQGEALADEGRTVLYFTRDNEPLGLIAVADPIKKTSRQAVAELRALGLDVVMLTGDNRRTAEAVRRRLGLERALAEVLPQDKEREIRALQSAGRRVAMVGDGVNDAPALARAEVGLALGAGTDIAIESADIVLMKSDPLDVAAAIQLSRAVMRNIRQNLFWAFFYNVVGIPVAAGVFYGLWGLTLSPMLAAAAMSLSSVSVVSNALRLRSFAPRRLTADENIDEPAAGTCAANSSVSNTSAIERKHIMKKNIHIEGMNCGHCTASVDKALRALAGVGEVAVDLGTKAATVEAGAGVTDDALRKAVTDLGFSVTGID